MTRGGIVTPVTVDVSNAKSNLLHLLQNTPKNFIPLFTQINNLLTEKKNGIIAPVNKITA